MIVYIVMLLIILFFITKIEFRIINVEDETDVYIKFGLIKIHIDYDMFVKEINRIKKDINFETIKDGISYYSIIKNIVNNSNVYIKRLDIIKKNNEYNFLTVFINTSFYTAYAFVKNFLLANTMKQENISFIIIPSIDNDIDVDINFEFSLFHFVKSFLFNIKNIIKLKKDMV